MILIYPLPEVYLLPRGTRTLTEFTANIIAESLHESFSKFKVDIKDILLCGGGRKNKFLINSIKKYK